jgi:hypothetical protein
MARPGIYIVVFSAIRRSEQASDEEVIALGAGTWIGSTKKDAEAWGEQLAHSEYPETEGFYRHFVRALLIPKDEVERLLWVLNTIGPDYEQKDDDK